MPTYEYACRSCGEHHDVVQSIGDEPLAECPSCGGPVRKVFGAVGVVFKGSGFYKTDSRSTSKKSDKVSASSDSTGNGTSGSAGKESSSGSSASKDSSSSKDSSGGSKDSSGGAKESKSTTGSAAAS
jgi:putative FmdB family regulatory protein